MPFDRLSNLSVVSLDATPSQHIVLRISRGRNGSKSVRICLMLPIRPWSLVLRRRLGRRQHAGGGEISSLLLITIKCFLASLATKASGHLVSLVCLVLRGNWVFKPNISSVETFSDLLVTVSLWFLFVFFALFCLFFFLDCQMFLSFMDYTSLSTAVKYFGIYPISFAISLSSSQSVAGSVNNSAGSSMYKSMCRGDGMLLMLSHWVALTLCHLQHIFIVNYLVKNIIYFAQA